MVARIDTENATIYLPPVAGAVQPTSSILHYYDEQAGQLVCQQPPTLLEWTSCKPFAEGRQQAGATLCGICYPDLDGVKAYPANMPSMDDALSLHLNATYGKGDEALLLQDDEAYGEWTEAFNPPSCWFCQHEGGLTEDIPGWHMCREVELCNERKAANIMAGKPATRITGDPTIRTFGQHKPASGLLHLFVEDRGIVYCGEYIDEVAWTPVRAYGELVEDDHPEGLCPICYSDETESLQPLEYVQEDAGDALLDMGGHRPSPGMSRAQWEDLNEDEQPIPILFSDEEELMRQK